MRTSQVQAHHRSPAKGQESEDRLGPTDGRIETEMRTSTIDGKTTKEMSSIMRLRNQRLVPRLEDQEISNQCEKKDRGSMVHFQEVFN